MAKDQKQKEVALVKEYHLLFEKLAVLIAEQKSLEKRLDEIRVKRIPLQERVESFTSTLMEKFGYSFEDAEKLLE